MPLSVKLTAAIITNVESALINKPYAILDAVVGSFPLFLMKEKKAMINGVSITTKNGFTD
jgi:hypothetical protein